MKNLSKTSKVILVITFVSYALWLGTYVAKNLIFFQFFEPGTMALKGVYAQADLLGIFYTVYPVITINIICYALFVIFFLLFTFTSKLGLRNNGWLFISLLVVILTMPVELYLIFKYDFNFAVQANNLTISVQPALELIKQRVTKFGMYSFVSIFSTVSILLFFIFKPLTKNEN